MASGEAQGVMVFTVETIRPPPTGGQAAMAAQRGKQVESDESYKRRVRLYAWAVPGMHRAGPGERGGASYGRRAVATAKWAAMQISGVGKGLRSRFSGVKLFSSTQSREQLSLRGLL